MPLSFYALEDDLDRLKKDLGRLRRAHPALQRDDRYQVIMTSLEEIIAEYEAKNSEFEADVMCEGVEWDGDNYQQCRSKETQQYTTPSGVVSVWFCPRHVPKWAK